MIEFTNWTEFQLMRNMDKYESTNVCVGVCFCVIVLIFLLPHERDGPRDGSVGWI